MTYPLRTPPADFFLKMKDSFRLSMTHGPGQLTICSSPVVSPANNSDRKCSGVTCIINNRSVCYLLYTFAFPTVTCQNVFCVDEKGFLTFVFLSRSRSLSIMSFVKNICICGGILCQLQPADNRQITGNMERKWCNKGCKPDSNWGHCFLWLAS